MILDSFNAELLVGWALGAATGALIALLSKRGLVVVLLGVGSALAVSVAASAIVQWSKDQNRQQELRTGPVRLAIDIYAVGPGGKLFSPETVVHPGDLVQFSLRIETVGTGTARSVSVGINAAPYLEFVCNSAQLKNSNYPSGVSLQSRRSESCPGKHLTEGGLELGSYEPHAAAYVSWQMSVDQTVQRGSTLTTVAVTRASRSSPIYNVVVLDVR